MKENVRELLVITKVAENWQSEFDQKVEELMSIVVKVDNDQHVQNAGEVLDVYNKSKKKIANVKRKRQSDDKPFEFFVFCN